MEAAVKVRLLTRWNGYLSNDIVSLSDARAEMLEKEGIGMIIDRPAHVEVPKTEAPEVKEEAADEEPKLEAKAKKK